MSWPLEISTHTMRSATDDRPIGAPSFLIAGLFPAILQQQIPTVTATVHITSSSVTRILWLPSLGIELGRN